MNIQILMPKSNKKNYLRMIQEHIQRKNVPIWFAKVCYRVPPVH